MKQTQHTETNQVQTLRSQERFIKYGYSTPKCHYCNEKLYQVTVEYIDFEGNVLVKPSYDSETVVNGGEYRSVVLNHENSKHHEVFQRDIATYKREVHERIKARKEANQ